jgi:hypothetical protein
MREYPCSYHTDASIPTFIEVLDDSGSLREYHIGCDRTNSILLALAKVTESKRLPLIVREPVLDRGFVQEMKDAPRNACRVSIPRFLVIDLDSFNAFVVD